VFHLWQTNFASNEESTGSPIRGLVIITITVLQKLTKTVTKDTAAL